MEGLGQVTTAAFDDPFSCRPAAELYDRPFLEARAVSKCEASAATGSDGEILGSMFGLEIMR